MYNIGIDNDSPLNEEQFVALFYSLGFFKDIGEKEEVLYNDLL